MKSAVLAAAFLALMALRAPFLSNVLIDEEGMFAHLVTGARPVVFARAQEALLVARIGGRDFMIPPEHPFGPYLFMNRVLRPLFGSAVGAELSFAQRSRLARTPFLAAFGAGLLMVFAAASLLRRTEEWTTLLPPLSAILFAATTPLMVGGSIQPQVDGSVGVLLVGTVCFLLVLASARSSTSPFLVPLAGFIGALGKNEWSLALLGAVIASLGARFVAGRRDGSDVSASASALRVSALLVAGLALGSLASYLLSPINFWSGFCVMNRISGSRSIALPQVLAHNFPFVWPVCVLFALATVLLGTQLRELMRERFGLLIVYAWGVALGVGFVFVAWGGDGFPRYYIPSMLALLCFIVAAPLSPSRAHEGAARFAAGLLLCGALANLNGLRESYKAGLSISSVPGTSNARQERRLADADLQSREQKAPVVVDAAFGYYYRDADFVARSLGEEGANKFLNVSRPFSRHSTKR